MATKDRDDFIPGKVFEYIRSQKPILAMVPPDGEVAEILKKLGHHLICEMENIQQIKLNLRQFINETKKQEINYDMYYSRENQTKVIYETIKREII